MSEQDLADHELGPAVQERFRSVLRDAGADPSGYLMLPAYPWQVDHVVHRLWSGSVLSGQIIGVGEAEDDYRPTQSIRTLVNVDEPSRLQVKLPLKILNTSVYRGIPRQHLVDALFLGVWSPLGQLLDGHGLPAASADLWNLTRRVITEYIQSHPEQARRLEATALLGPEFGRYPLNGYRLLTGYTDLDTRPPVPKAGFMPNPMHRP